MHTTTVTLTGHLMDTGILARVLDDVLEYGGDYRIESLDVGRQHEDESRALVEIRAEDAELLERIVMRLQVHGANPVDPGTATARPAPTRRGVPRGLLLHDQPGHLRPARARVAAGRPGGDGLRPGRRGAGRPTHDPQRAGQRRARRRGGDLRGARRARRDAAGGRAGRGGELRVHVLRRCPARSPRRCWCARSPSRCARSRRPASASCGSVARRSCTPAPPRRWSAWCARATSTSCSPATPWRRTTSSRRCSAPRSASTWPRGRGCRTGTSTTSGRSTRSGRPARSPRPSTTASSPAA